MGKNITPILVFLFFLTLFVKTTEVKASYVPEDTTSESEEVSSKKLGGEAEILQAYLAKFNSPMQFHAQDFIDAAREYNLDWKLIPAIAGVESTFGKHIPGGYNAYGWGVYGTNRIYFTSWRDGMFTVAKGLRENYLNKGYTEPYSINRIYAASPHWGKNVTFFMNDLEKFANGYSQITTPTQIDLAPVVAVISGQIASN